MTTLICGSLAFDNIMVFPDRFKNHILPEQIHILNVAFMVPEMRREYGGCAGDIVGLGDDCAEPDTDAGGLGVGGPGEHAELDAGDIVLAGGEPHRGQ